MLSTWNAVYTDIDIYAFWGQSLTLMIAIQLAIGQFSNLFSLVFIAIGAMTAYITSKN